MASTVCRCSHVIRPHSFPNQEAYYLVGEEPYDRLPDPVTDDSLRTLFANSTQVLHRPRCGRLIVYWRQPDGSWKETFHQRENEEDKSEDYGKA
jgi:hypothetical protein